MRFKLLAAALLATAAPLASGIASAAVPAEASAKQPEPTPEQKAFITRMKALLESLHPEQGDVTIVSAKAVLHLGKDYYFLPAEEAKKVLTEGWGNPPEAVGSVLGMVFPKGRTFLDDSWGAVVTYQPTGYVSDDDAKTVDYDEMVKTQQDSEAEMNAERAKAGYPAQHLVGWAQPPAYDPGQHSLIWARRISIAGEPEDTLNYDVRMLGRHGVLSMNMVTTVSHLDETRAAAAAIGKAAAFDTGARYADYNPGMDKKAEFGIGGLVAAGVGIAAAKKLGLLGAILLFGKKFLVLILAGGAAVVAWFKRKFAGAPEE